MDFGKRFMDRIRYDEPMATRAVSGALPDRLSPLAIAWLAYDLDSKSHEEEGKINWARMALAITQECERGTIKAHYSAAGIPQTPIKGSPWDSPLNWWHIHFDDARRYFQSLDLMPDDGTPLWHWLRGKAADKKSLLTKNQQDKADFQTLCQDRWNISPNTTITGEGGIVIAVGGPYLRGYGRVTLEGWAREVAPEGVRGKRGRPKISVSPEK